MINMTRKQHINTKEQYTIEVLFSVIDEMNIDCTIHTFNLQIEHHIVYQNT